MFIIRGDYMKKIITILFFIFILTLSSVNAATQNDLGSNLKAALSQQESEKNLHTASNGYEKPLQR